VCVCVYVELQNHIHFTNPVSVEILNLINSVGI